MTYIPIPAKGDRVALFAHVLVGTIASDPRFDDWGVAIYSIKLDDPTATPDGWYTARRWEFKVVTQLEIIKERSI